MKREQQSLQKLSQIDDAAGLRHHSYARGTKTSTVSNYSLTDGKTKHNFQFIWSKSEDIVVSCSYVQETRQYLGKSEFQSTDQLLPYLLTKAISNWLIIKTMW